MKISVITQDQELCQMLVAGNAPESFIAISDGVRLKYEHTLSISALSSSGYTAQLIIFVLEHCDAVVTSLLAAWFYERLIGRKVKLHIGNDDDVVISPEAIRQALEMGQEGDVIILAGKGHETYQDIMGVKRPFDEKVVVKELLAEMNSAKE